MELFETIKTRRSVRNFTGEAIPSEDLETIVDAGRLAASGSNIQPWEFIIVTDQETIDTLKIAAGWMGNASAIICIVMDTSSRWWLEDASSAAANMLLAITALGYGGCWVEGNALPLEDRFKKLLGVPDDKRMPILIPVGVPKAIPQKEKKEMGEILYWEKYGA